MTLLIFLIILSVLVFVHELGHFWTAKKNGIYVEEFGFGLPPRIWGKKIGETIYSINWLPIGGFVKLLGEDAIENRELKIDDGELQRAFFMQKKRVRALVLTAGVIMNFLLGVVLFSVIYTTLGIPTQTDVVKIVGVLQESPANNAGLEVGDVVVSVDGETIKSTDTFVKLLKSGAGSEVEIQLGLSETVRSGELVTIVPREDPPEGEGAIGAIVSSTETKFFPFWQMPFRGAWFGLKEAVGWGVMIVVGFYTMIRNLIVSGVVPADVAGPVGIYQLTGTVAQAGFLSILQFVGILSVNLAVLNILPFPALDGGRLLFLGIEAVTKKKVGGNVERWIHGAGMAVLLGLLVLVTLNDVVRITESGTIVGLVQKVLPF